ncbi:swi5-dependent recombination DNA repair protein 1 homolog [Lingula anatina]|uniref:Swi5-dependent recombination DNA repair protein 1 homolog n=1 Tax=Lingula anatina TaxID=7574 RepID=A0A1S3JQX9_LINAN|nr:swi5-dependent recombination DNA repair protein 1 homolog [Lingula anatina]XP_013412770.1 swi5-dependent recombination DNA repair protein 1 homolog [Lingula anatina]|eukprot:XP_013412762.1 swi5-dependent recombination DNA repair protein 1 homolog [Lingula anatina]
MTDRNSLKRTEEKIPHLAGRQMSNSLRARLQKCSRYHMPAATTESPVVGPDLASCSQSAHKSTSCVKPHKVLTFSSPLPNPKPMESHIEVNKRTPKRSLQDICDDKFPFRRKNKELKTCQKDENVLVEKHARSVNTIPTEEAPSKDKFTDSVSRATQVDKETDASAVKDTHSISDLDHINLCLQQQIEFKEEQLRRLKMAKLYRSKNDLDKLQGLITKWKHVCQGAIQELRDLAPEPKPTLTEIVDHFQIDHKLLDYDAEDETFL